MHGVLSGKLVLVQLPLTQLAGRHGSNVMHEVQAAPPVPHACITVPGWQMLLLMQPLQHVPLAQRPVGHAVPLGAGTSPQVPAAVQLAWRQGLLGAVQAAQVCPLRPQRAGVCAPSRAGLLLGLHPIATGSQHMRTTTRPAGAYWSVPPPEAKAFPELLRAAGHYTYNVAKTDYQFSPPLGGGPFTIWDANGLGVAPTDWPAHRTFFGMVNLGVTHESGVFRPLGARPRSPMHFALQLARAFELRGAPSVAPTDPS